MRSRRLATAAWLAVLVAVNAVLLAVVVRFAVHTVRGQMLDTVALAGRFAEGPLFGPVNRALNTALDAISVASLVVVLAVVGLIAFARRRFALGIMAVVLVAGSTLTAYVMKNQIIERSFLGVDPQRAYAGNSLPSGHATAAAAFAVGLVMVIPRQFRGVASLAGAAYAAVVGIATLSAGWHRPSDVIAAYLVVGGWAALAGLLLLLIQPPFAVVSEGDRAWLSLIGTTLGGLALLGIGGATLWYVFQRMTEPVERMSHRLLSLGYWGSALAIAGAASLMMAVVLSTIHEVVPRHTDPPWRREAASAPGVGPH